jgi:hypothetical protein
MMIDPISLASITSAVAVLSNEYLKGVANEAGKATWTGIKSLLGWTSDPEPAEIPVRIASAISTAPDIAEKLLEILKNNHTGTATALVGKIEASGGKIVVANTINTSTFHM